MPNNLPSQPEFPIVRRGFDPDSVDRYLAAVQRELDERVAAAEARYSNLEAALAEARKREEAVHLTLVAATKTKEELIVNARREAEETMSNARERAEELLSAAKKEAFRLVTDARQSSQEMTTVARAGAEETTAKAQAAAESIRDSARLEAIQMINSVETDTTSLLAAREAALEEMRARYEEEEATLTARIEILGKTANDLETRLKAIAAGTLDQASNLVTGLPAAQPIAPAAERPAEPRVDQPTTHDLRETPVTAAQPEDATENARSSAEVTASFTELPAPPVVRPEAPAVAPALNGHDTAWKHAYVEPVADDLDEDVFTAKEEADEPLEPVAAEPEVSLPEEIEEPEAVAEPEPDVTAEPPAAEEEELVEEAEPVRVPAAVGAARFEERDGRKGSYYSRRSAKLPRIGNEAGRNALAAANAIRGATRTIPPDDLDSA